MNLLPPMPLLDHEPDAFEKGVRFGCGVLFAVPIGLYAAWECTGRLTWSELGLSAAFALVAGFLAMRYGDGFWHLCARLFSSW